MEPFGLRTLVLDVFADSQSEHDAALDRIHNVLEYDLCALTPGKLWINDRYVRCFATASVKTLDRDWTTYTVVGLTLKLISPAWVKEETVAVLPVTAASASSDKKYLGKYRTDDTQNIRRLLESLRLRRGERVFRQYHDCGGRVRHDRSARQEHCPRQSERRKDEYFQPAKEERGQFPPRFSRRPCRELLRSVRLRGDIPDPEKRTGALR